MLMWAFFSLCNHMSTYGLASPSPIDHMKTSLSFKHGPLARYVKLQVAHAPGMSGTFSPADDFKGNRYLAIPACITARAWRTCRDACRDRLPAVTEITFPAFPAHAHPQFCVSGKRPMGTIRWVVLHAQVSPQWSSHAWFADERIQYMYYSPP